MNTIDKILTLAAAAMLTATQAMAQGAATEKLQITKTNGVVVEYAANEVKSVHIEKETGTVTVNLVNGSADNYVCNVSKIGFAGTKGTQVADNLSDYGPLKSYVNREAYPNFALGAATDVNDLQNPLYGENFDEIVAGNEFKYGSCVNSSGGMNFTSVRNFIYRAEKAGLRVYGHCLAWHSQQQPAYLNSLITLSNPGTVQGEVFSYTFDDGNQLNGWGNNQQRSIVTGSHDGSKCLKVVNPSKANSWESQVAADFSPALTANETVTLTFWAKASAATTISANLQYPNSDAGYPNRGDFGQVSLTTGWKQYTLTTTVNGSNATRVLFNVGNLAGNIWFDDVKLSGSRTETMSQQQKLEVLTGAMEKWIKGIMTACNGKVKAWDVVNEAISGGGADGNYPLQHGSNTSSDFFWQDHMGDLEYVRTAVRLARQYGPEGVKLFINDYNLESDWDNNGKLRSLINWIKKWEADGVTYIDGIGTQMHISCSMNSSTLASRKRAITNMFKLMAATGKYVRVSELDMGMQDASGNTLKTNQLTEAQHKMMADFYKYIVDQYLSIVPPSQQWGICQWCAGDAAESQWGWRPGEPVGLWNEAKTARKQAYKGFADGLAGYQ